MKDKILMAGFGVIVLCAVSITVMTYMNRVDAQEWNNIHSVQLSRIKIELEDIHFATQDVLEVSKSK